MLGHAIRGCDIREPFIVDGQRVWIIGALLLIGGGIVLDLRIKRIANHGLEWLVVRWQRTVFQSAINVQPTNTVGVQDEGLVAWYCGHALSVGEISGIVWSLVEDEVRAIKSRPFTFAFVPPNEFLTFAPRLAVRTR